MGSISDPTMTDGEHSTNDCAVELVGDHAFSPFSGV
jgi:hypothetical protein